MFDQRIKSGDGKLAGIKIDICDVETAGVCRGSTHAILGHPCKHITNLTAKFLDLNKMMHDKICESYIKGKQHQKNVAKKVEFKAKNRAVKSTLILVAFSTRVWEVWNFGSFL